MEFIINLQLFSEEKTEKATPKKLRESREKGQVLQSKEINSATMLLGAFAVVSFAGGFIGNSMLKLTQFVYQDYLSLDYIFSQRNLLQLMTTALIYILVLSLPIAGICLIIGLVSSYMQVGFLFTTKPLGIKFSKLNPIEGFKRMFSLKSLVELVKSFIKIVAVGYVVLSYARGQISTILNTIEMNVESIVTTLSDIAIGIGYRAGLVLVFLAILDYMYQKYDYEKQMKMTKQEIKEEYKQTEGNPQIKSKIREKQRQISMRRMMQEVPKADVIITNPTHFAIAVKYDPHQAQAPKVLAKGQDLIAQQIKKNSHGK